MFTFICVTFVIIRFTLPQTLYACAQRTIQSGSKGTPLPKTRFVSPSQTLHNIYNVSIRYTKKKGENVLLRGF